MGAIGKIIDGKYAEFANNKGGGGAAGGDADTIGGKDLDHIMNFENLTNKPPYDFVGTKAELEQALEDDLLPVGTTVFVLDDGSDSSGVPVGNVQNLSKTEGTDTLTLAWEDPQDIVFNNEPVAQWAGTKVMRKEGSYSEDENDGTLVVDSTVRDQYITEGFQDTDVLPDVEYHYTLFPYTEKNVYTKSDLNKVSGSLKPYDPVLANNTWEQIDQASREGVAKELWNPGDEKDGYTIIGFDHDDLADGSGKAGITFVISDKEKMQNGVYHSGNFNMPYNGSNAKETMDNIYENGEDGIADLKPYIKKVKKYFYAVPVTSTLYNIECHLFLLSASEIMNPLPAGVKYEEARYEGMKSDEIRNLVNAGYWTRTRRNSTSVHQAFVCGTDGSLQSYNLSTSFYLRYGFCI